MMKTSVQKLKAASNFPNRRNFLKTISGAGLLLAAGGFPTEIFADEIDDTLTILHTNDWHSRIEPFPMDGGKYAGEGGAAQRAFLINQIRSEQKNVLLLDAGDIFQGTPYFNFYHGELEMKLMSEMGYDASAIGNHDFDAGVDGLAAQLPNANFPLLCANYNFTNTSMEGKTLQYKTFQRGKIKIGVFGLGIELSGLVPDKLFGNTVYSEPISIANKIAAQLRNDEQCHLVICLSHLGFQYADDKVSDEVLAKNTSNIDLIIGGHTHTFFDAPISYINASGKNVLVNQVGWAGLILGRLDYTFKKSFSEHHVKHQSVRIRK